MNPRQAAFEALATQAARFPDLLPMRPATARLDARDTALARAIYDTAVRRWRTLTWLIGHASRRPPDTIEPRIQAALLAGGAQLLFMDRVPDHAAINESVEWAKRAVRPGAGGFVNGVLRAITRMRRGVDNDISAVASLARRDCIAMERGALVLTSALLPEGDLERLALVAGIPDWQIDRWAASLGADAARHVALHSLAVAPAIVNAHCARAPIGDETWEPHEEPGFLVAPATADLSRALKGRNDVWVQDPGSARAVADLDLASEPKLIVDYCAGRGGKRRQLAMRFPKAQIIACDVDPERHKAIGQVAGELANVETRQPGEIALEFAGRADLVVLDVPCTNTGVLARRLEARHRCSQAQLARLVAVQRQIITDTIPLVSDTGQVLYSTCSLEAEEGPGHAPWAEKWHDIQVVREALNLPTGGPGVGRQAYRDGGLWMLLRPSGSAGR